MESCRAAAATIVPGAVYRHEVEATHSPMFHQVEGFMVDRNVTFADLKGVLTHVCGGCSMVTLEFAFVRVFFPSPSPAPRSISIASSGGGRTLRNGEPCRVCKATGWLEIFGAGLIDSAVFKFVGYDPEEFQGSPLAWASSVSRC